MELVPLVKFTIQRRARGNGPSSRSSLRSATQPRIRNRKPSFLLSITTFLRSTILRVPRILHRFPLRRGHFLSLPIYSSSNFSSSLRDVTTTYLTLISSASPRWKTSYVCATIRSDGGKFSSVGDPRLTLSTTRFLPLGDFPWLLVSILRFLTPPPCVCACVCVRVRVCGSVLRRPEREKKPRVRRVSVSVEKSAAARDPRDRCPVGPASRNHSCRRWLACRAAAHVTRRSYSGIDREAGFGFSGGRTPLPEARAALLVPTIGSPFVARDRWCTSLLCSSVPRRRRRRRDSRRKILSAVEAGSFAALARFRLDPRGSSHVHLMPRTLGRLCTIDSQRLCLRDRSIESWRPLGRIGRVQARAGQNFFRSSTITTVRRADDRRYNRRRFRSNTFPLFAFLRHCLRMCHHRLSTFNHRITAILLDDRTTAPPDPDIYVYTRRETRRSPRWLLRDIERSRDCAHSIPVARASIFLSLVPFLSAQRAPFSSAAACNCTSSLPELVGTAEKRWQCGHRWEKVEVPPHLRRRQTRERSRKHSPLAVYPNFLNFLVSLRHRTTAEFGFVWRMIDGFHQGRIVAQNDALGERENFDLTRTCLDGRDFTYC